HVQALLHDETDGDGHGTFDLPFHRRSAWRPALGLVGGTGRHVPVHRPDQTQRAAMKSETHTVVVIDDDLSVREALQGLLETAALNVELYASPREYLQTKRSEQPSCIILDVRLPGSSGLDFQRELLDAGMRIPIIFITGHGDIPMTVQAMKAGAVEF